jgi:segregation and condensation protein B
MSDDNTPDVTVEENVDEAIAAAAPAASKSRRGKGRATPAVEADRAAGVDAGEVPEAEPEPVTAAVEHDGDVDVELPDTEPIEATPEGGDASVVSEASMSASAFEAITGELKDSELFDPEEVANAPRAPHPLKPVVEALIFASPEPLTPKAIARLLDDQPREDIETALAEVRESYLRSDGLQLVEVAGGFQIVTRPELYEWVRRLFKERTTSKLSVQALETLAVIAYKQPVTSGEIAEIRGVSATTGVLNTLLDRKLVKIVGRKQVVGRPFMYGTTREFLDKFGLRDLSDLPKVEDMSEALGFDLPSGVDGGDGVSLPFDDAAPAEPLLFADHESRASASQEARRVAEEPIGSPEPLDEVSLDADAPAEPDAPDEER